VYVLLHNLLTSGDGSASLKWGSTNAYAEDGAGKPKGSVSPDGRIRPETAQSGKNSFYQFTKHLRERYGDAEVKGWLKELWNEPDIDYWRGSREEFFKLYDHTAEGILRAVPGAKVDGPDTTGAAGRNAEEGPCATVSLSIAGPPDTAKKAKLRWTDRPTGWNWTRGSTSCESNCRDRVSR
jgi:xylan 1,4-beta-xylosidase